jgi:hypothetical protein
VPKKMKRLKMSSTRLGELPNKTLLEEVIRRYPLGHEFADDLHKALHFVLSNDELLDQVRETLDEDYFEYFESALRKLLEAHNLRRLIEEEEDSGLTP